MSIWNFPNEFEKVTNNDKHTAAYEMLMELK